MNDNGGAAFPSPGVVVSDGRGDEMQKGAYEGMTLRDYFAAKALSGLLGNSEILYVAIDAIEQPVSTITGAAIASYEIADAMLAAREVTK